MLTTPAHHRECRTQIDLSDQRHRQGLAENVARPRRLALRDRSEHFDAHGFQRSGFCAAHSQRTQLPPYRGNVLSSSRVRACDRVGTAGAAARSCDRLLTAWCTLTLDIAWRAGESMLTRIHARRPIARGTAMNRPRASSGMRRGARGAFRRQFAATSCQRGRTRIPGASAECSHVPLDA